MIKIEPDYTPQVTSTQGKEEHNAQEQNVAHTWSEFCYFRHLVLAGAMSWPCLAGD